MLIFAWRSTSTMQVQPHKFKQKIRAGILFPTAPAPRMAGPQDWNDHPLATADDSVLYRVMLALGDDALSYARAACVCRRWSSVATAIAGSREVFCFGTLKFAWPPVSLLPPARALPLPSLTSRMLKSRETKSRCTTSRTSTRLRCRPTRVRPSSGRRQASCASTRE